MYAIFYIIFIGKLINWEQKGYFKLFNGLILMTSFSTCTTAAESLLSVVVGGMGVGLLGNVFNFTSCTVVVDGLVTMTIFFTESVTRVTLSLTVQSSPVQPSSQKQVSSFVHI